MKNVIFALLLAGLSLLLMLGGVELYVRVTQTDGKNFDIEMWRYARDMKKVSDIPGMGHRHVPNTSGVYMGVPVTINSVGWRDKDYSLDKPSNTVRIMMLGDSVTFGWGAQPDGVTSAVLEKLLNQSNETSYEVLNTGIGNLNAAMQVAYFLHEGYRYQPDVVVLNYFINDAEPTPVRTENFIVEHSYAAVFLAGRFDILKRTYLGQSDWQTYYKNLYSDHQDGWKETKEALRHLIEFCQEKNVKLLVANYPELHQLSPYPFREVTALITAQAMSHHVPFVDLLPSVVHEEPQSLWVTSTDAHPNGKAGKLFAAQLKRTLSETFPSLFYDRISQ